MQNRETFDTSDTPLAAYLAISGIRFIELDASDHPCIFRFATDDNHKLNDLLTAWDIGTPTGDCRAFARTYRGYIRRIKAAQMARNGQKT